MNDRKQPGAAKAALITQYTDVVVAVGSLEGQELLTDTYHLKSETGRHLSVNDLEPFFNVPGKTCLGFRGISGDDIGVMVFHPNITDKIRNYVHELINKSYPLEDHTELKVTDGHVIIDLDELDEIKPQGGVN